MQVFYGFKKLRKFKKPVVALGVFDGVHKGHAVILSSAVKQAKKIKGTSVTVTFWPHPHKEESLISLGHRLKLIAELGIDACIVIRFNKKFARISAGDFIKNILYKKIGARFIFVGTNFNFGSGGRGDAKFLKANAKKYNFKLKVFPVLKINQQVISSTLIRQLIKSGKLEQAEKMLRQPVSILGTVIKGNSLARKLGFPTANIDPHHEVMPPSGVYIVKVVLGKKIFYGVCSIGTKPTFYTKKLQHIEVHLFNFRKDIYGKYLEIYFIEKIRNQKKFSSHVNLTKEIKKDIIYAKHALSLPQKHHNS